MGEDLPSGEALLTREYPAPSPQQGTPSSQQATPSPQQYPIPSKQPLIASLSQQPQPVSWQDDSTSCLIPPSLFIPPSLYIDHCMQYIRHPYEEFKGEQNHTPPFISLPHSPSQPPPDLPSSWMLPTSDPSPLRVSLPSADLRQPPCLVRPDHSTSQQGNG